MAKAITQVLSKHIIGKSKTEVLEMFDAIAPNYDKFTSLFSFGIDHYWRESLTLELKNISLILYWIWLVALGHKLNRYLN